MSQLSERLARRIEALQISRACFGTGGVELWKQVEMVYAPIVEYAEDAGYVDILAVYENDGENQ